MPVPAHKGAFRVTGSDFEAPYSTPTLSPGQGGLNLRNTISTIQDSQLTRMSNVTWDREGALTSRPGMLAHATSAGTQVHTIRRMSDPLSASSKKIWGIDTDIYLGFSGALGGAISSGYSGRPLSVVPYRPTHSGESWAYVGDSEKTQKIRRDGLALDIGLPAPENVVGAALGTENTTRIVDFDTTDSSEAATWTPHKGTSFGALPTLSDLTSSQRPGNHLYMETFQANNTTDYYQFAYHALSIDLSKVGTTTGTETDAIDEDHIHLWMKFSNPNFVNEVRIYIIVSDNFNPASLTPPGTDPTSNTDSYVKSFRPGDSASHLTGNFTAVDEARGVAIRESDEEFIENLQNNPRLRKLEEGGFIDEDGDIVPYSPTGTTAGRKRTLKTVVSTPGGSGAHEWIEFGVPDNPLRRSEFRRVGSTPDRDWSTVTGICIFVSCVPQQGVGVGFQSLYLTGGAGPDNTDPGLAGYDYRYTDFDPRSGTESNPSPIEPDAEPYGIFSVRRPITLTPTASGDAANRQRFYRRGGTLGDNWYRIPNSENANDTNDSDGGVFTDSSSDAGIEFAPTLHLDHDQPVTTLDTDGNIIRHIPVAAMWGPVQDIIFACGDKYRPGHLYWCNPGEPDHWGSGNTFEVCSPSEELMHGGVYANQAFVFSRERMYWIFPNLDGSGAMTVTGSSCTKGLFSRWGLTVGHQGIFFVNRDGVWRSDGGPPQLISQQLGDEDDGGIFSQTTVNGYAPIDWAFARDIQLNIWGTELWFQYRGTDEVNHHLVFDIESQRWKFYDFAVEVGTVFTDVWGDGAGKRLVLGGRASGDAYTHEGTSDNTEPIVASFRTGAWDAGRGREDKLLGDLFMDLDRDETVITVKTYLNDEEESNPADTIEDGTGRYRYVLDAFGEVPQRVRSISVDASWSAIARQPKIHQIGVSVIQEPEATNLRATQWDDVGAPAEKYLMGVMIECDTFGEDRPVVIEYMQGTTIYEAKTFTITHSGRRRHFESWTGVQADRVRIRPDDGCAPWILYECDWIAHDEPTRIPNVDSHWENEWDTYSTGLDLFINTFNETKTFKVEIDGTLITNPVSGTTDFSVTANGRQVVHLSWTPRRGHVYRYYATDDFDCLLYEHRWHLDQEPSEQTNWNQNFTIANTHADKWIKGVKLECDTFGVNKTVTIEVDGTVAATLTINTPDRRVVQRSFAQVRGRVVRILPTDTNPGRLYTAGLIFDEEPLALDRWETQELTLGPPGWKSLLEGWITIRSTATVTLTATFMREDGTSTSAAYTLPNTSNVKTQHYLTFGANKFVQVKFLFTSAADFYLYRPESSLKLADWGGQVRPVSPFGDDNLDLTRTSYFAETVAAEGGGTRV